MLLLIFLKKYESVFLEIVKEIILKVVSWKADISQEEELFDKNKRKIVTREDEDDN